MTRLVSCALYVTLAALSARAQALNAASYSVPGAPGYGVAQGSMFVLFGKDLGPNTPVQASKLPLDTELAGTIVQVTVGADNLNAYLVYTSATQVAAVLPSNTPTGDGQVRLTYGGRTSNPIPIGVVKTTFGIFARNQAGSGPGIVQNLRSAQDAPTNALNASAQPGQTAVIWGTGLGPIKGNDASVPPVGDLGVDVSVLVGGKTVKPDYAGRSSEFPGIDQINFKVPDGISGCYVPVAVKAAGALSNFVSMSIASNGGTCSDATSFAATDIDAAAANGSSRIGLITASRVSLFGPFGNVDSQTDTGAAEFRLYGFNPFVASRGLATPRPALGTCTAIAFRVASNDPAALYPADAVSPLYLNAGNGIAINGNGGGVVLSRQVGGWYTGPTQQIFLDPGLIQAQGSGGSDVNAFTQRFSLRDPVTWTDVQTQYGGTISRSSNLTVNWSGGDNTNEFALIRGSSFDAQTGVRGTFTCTAAVSAGRFTVPADVLSVLPASNVGPGDLPGFLEVGSATRTGTGRFTGNGLDGGYFQVQRTSRVPAAFQ